MYKARYVRIFNYICCLFIATYSQSEEVYIKSLDPMIIEDSLNHMLENQIDLSLTYNLESYSLFPSYSIYKATKNVKTVDSLLFNDGIDIDKHIINQIFKPYRNAAIGEHFTQIGSQLMSRYYFISKIPDYHFGKINDYTLGAMMKFEPNFESSVSGIVGFNKLNNRSRFIGEINLNLENYLKKAEKFNLFWKRTDSLSQVITIGTFLPHPFNWNNGVEMQYHHEVFEGLYAFREKKLLLHTFLPMLNSFNLGYTTGQIIPTETGLFNGYKKSQYKAFSVVSKNDVRNDRLFPSRGKLINSTIDGGLDNEIIFFKGYLEMQSFHGLKNDMYIKLQWMGHGIGYLNNQVPKSRYLHFGGSKTLRGYQEHAFIATQYQVFTLEFNYRPLLSLQTNFFADIGSTELIPTDRYLIGYGIGLNQINENSIIKLVYALSNEKKSNGKIHIILVSRF